MEHLLFVEYPSDLAFERRITLSWLGIRIIDARTIVFQPLHSHFNMQQRRIIPGSPSIGGNAESMKGTA